MWNFVESYKQRRAREKFMPRPRTRSSGTTQKVAIAALLLILATMAILQMRGKGSETEAFIDSFAGDTVPALDLIERASASRRLVFLADVPSAAAPKELAAAAIERLARGNGLDLVALEIDASEQPWIDRYLAAPEEDASLLLSRPRLVHEAEGVSRAYMDILRAVRRVNDELGADRGIRILALDPPGWPPAGSESPARATQLFGERDGHMYETLQPILAADPKMRVLLFVGGLHALKSGAGVVQTGGTRTVETQWLAQRLQETYPQDVFTILVDATPSRIPATHVASYRGTAAGPVLRDAGMRPGSGALIDAGFDFSRDPVTTTEKPGIQFSLTPQDLKFSQIADAYIYLGS